jgi:hypothetical protein
MRHILLTLTNQPFGPPALKLMSFRSGLTSNRVDFDRLNHRRTRLQSPLVKLFEGYDDQLQRAVAIKLRMLDSTAPVSVCGGRLGHPHCLGAWKGDFVFGKSLSNQCRRRAWNWPDVSPSIRLHSPKILVRR